MRNFFKSAWRGVKTLWSRLAETVGKFIDDFSVRRVNNMKGFQVITEASMQAPIDSVAVQIDKIDDWNIVWKDNVTVP